MASKRILLAVQPRVKRFSAAQTATSGKAELHEKLQSQRETQPVVIDREQDVLLDHYGYIQGRYRLTVAALSQLCSELCPGLANVILSIAGARKRSTSHSNEAYSVRRAINTLNDMIRFRFSVLKGRARLVIDRRAKHIEGIVGPKYHFLSNLELFSRVEKYLAQAAVQECQFYEAILAGRRMLLRYRNLEPTFRCVLPTSTKEEKFYSGWHFSNGELGDCSVKGAAALFRGLDGACSISGYSDETRLVHLRGRKFEFKLGVLMGSVREQVYDLSALEDGMPRLAGRPLGFSTKREDCDRRRSQLLSILSKAGAPKKAADEALDSTLVHGASYYYKTDPGEYSRGIGRGDAVASLAVRTEFDLYANLCGIARSHPPDQRERLEQVAYKLLTCDLTLW